MEKEIYIPVVEYAKLKGLSVQAIYQSIAKGTRKGKKIGSYQLVLKD